MRGKQATKRIIAPDPAYNNTNVAKFTNYLMKKGKKSTAQEVISRAFKIIEEKTKRHPVDVFETAIKNVSPSVEVKARRVGGANYQVPMEVRGDRKFQLACRWILEAARGRKGQPMAEKLAAELMAAAENEGDALKKKEEMHRMAEANRAFAHFA
jgi:small subunit ribosomal protein S7